MTQLCADALLAVRQLARSWGIVIISGLTIALAVAASATTLTVFNAVLLRPLPFPRPDGLYRILRRSSIDSGRSDHAAVLRRPRYSPVTWTRVQPRRARFRRRALGHF
jgi:hypothetical protein